MRLILPFLLLAATLSLHAGKDSGLITKAPRKDVPAFALSHGPKTNTLAETKGQGGQRGERGVVARGEVGDDGARPRGPGVGRGE